ncbi:DUF6979 family protein [Methanoculleus bourgensis]|jgi:hypothetical protein|uniref:Uncharacterized protein n=1 Tax=Methanoculleus bourgensis TaxID=83986 RepID=A0A0X3BNX3_9EURY|nr:hypothetical protein [Methanoculleus bourgensis]CVK33748.1 conserved protein of unknown function [Methanoculleus bourgensis]
MGNYGRAAVRAVKLIHDGTCKNPEDAWRKALNEYTHSESSRNKSCPREAFLGLCEEGMVMGIPAGDYTSSTKNKAYAINAVGILRESKRELKQKDLWKRAAPGTDHHNGQMDVVLSLWEQGFIR